jgi:FKBP-type peptidyl-prolyl cis-trans isomerase
MTRTLFALPLVALTLVGVVAVAEEAGPPADTAIQTTASGLKYSVLKAGQDGRSPKLGDTVVVHYTGWLEDGTVFDSSRKRGSPARFVVGQVIEGWNEALAMMTEGARWKLTIPANLAYGDRARGLIPAGATLIFDVELLEIVSFPVFRETDESKLVKTESGPRLRGPRRG